MRSRQWWFMNYDSVLINNPGPECHRLSLLNQYIPIVYRRFSTESEWPKGTLLAKYVQYKSRKHFFPESRMNMMIWVFHNVHSVFRKKWNFRIWLSIKIWWAWIRIAMTIPDWIIHSQYDFPVHSQLHSQLYWVQLYCLYRRNSLLSSSSSSVLNWTELN